MKQIKWSRETPFTKEDVDKVPETSGVYEFLQSEQYCRYKGQTRTIKFGLSRKSLRQELKNHFNPHTTTNRIKRIQKKQCITFRYLEIPMERVKNIEGEFLKEFEDEHWDLPVCNSERGYSRYEDKHYK